MSGTQWGWSGPGANQPVGARLFGPRQAPTVPGNALPDRAMRERAMLHALYGLGAYGPPVPPEAFFGAGAPIEAARPVMPQERLSGLPPEWQALLNAPPQAAQPMQGNAIMPPQGASDPVVVPPTIPPELDPSNTPRTAAARPDMRTDPTPQNPGEANWMALLQRFLPGADNSPQALLDSDPTPQGDSEYPRMLPGMQAARNRRQASAYGQDNPGIAPDRPFTTGQSISGPGGAEGDLPVPPVPPGEEAPGSLPGVPRGTDNAAAAAPARTRYAEFQGQLPTGQAALDAYNAARPRERERDPEERTLRLIAAALAGGMRGTGLGVGAGAAAGLGAGYGQESDRDEALWQRNEGERQRFQQGLAGLLGQQEQRAFDNMMQQQTFNRQSQIAGDADARAREGLGIQRQAAGEQSLLRRLRMQRLLEQSGVEAQPAQVLTRGVAHVVQNPGTQLLITDEQGRSRPLTFQVGNQELTLAQLQDRLLQQRGNPANARLNPLFATNPQLARDQTRNDLGDLLMQRIMGLTPAQQRQIMLQMLPMIQSRARAGSQELADE